MKRFFKWIDINFEPMLITVIFFVMFLLLTLQVILRFFFEIGFPWAEELARYLFVWLVFSCLSFAVRNNKQISVSFLRGFLSERMQKVIMIIVDILFLLFLILFGWSSLKIVGTTAYYGDKGLTLPVSLNILYVAPVLGYTLMILRGVQTFWWKIRRRNASLALFSNHLGIYSQTNEVFHMPQSFRDDLGAMQDKTILEEERNLFPKKYNKEN